MVDEVGLGFACFLGVGDPPPNGKYTYRHAGLVETEDMALRWLSGDPGIELREITFPVPVIASARPST